MSTVPPAGPKEPSGPLPKGPAQPPEPISEPSSSLLNSPWAKMFESMGVLPTAEQIHQMMANLIRQQLAAIKKDQERMKKAARKMKREIEGKE